VEKDPSVRRQMMRSRNHQRDRLPVHRDGAAGVVITKFVAGAWIAILAMVSLFVR
jgi:hypothetical protein